MMTMNNSDVIVGRDGWLFLGAGSNDFMSYIKGEATLPQQTLDYWQAILTRRQVWFRNQGIKYLHVFAPEKITIYPNHSGETLDTSLGHITTLARRFPDLFLNVLNYFNAIKGTYQLYDKTDTHWNRAGAFACYQLICSQLGYQPLNDLMAGPKVRINGLLDLGSKVNPQLREKIDLVRRANSASRTFANLLVRFKEINRIENEAGLHVGSRVVFQNEKAPYKERIVIFGDSFTEYRPGRLVEMFAETFSEVHFCWSANVDYAYVKRVCPNIVVTELAERFAVSVPSDDFAVDKFARERLITYMQKRTVATPNLAQQSERHLSESTRMLTRRRPVLPDTGLRGPDYIILGAMKCGTTILNDFICTHPEVFTAKEKEIHYFSLHYDKGESWYADFFSGAPDNKLTGEASPTYLDMTNGPTLPQLMRKTLPDLKVMAIIKDPVDRAISHFFHLKNVNKLSVFQTLDPNEVFSGDLFRKYHEEFLLDHTLWPLRNILEFGNYYQRLLFYRQTFGDNMLIIAGRDLWEDGQKVMDRVFAHLDLPSYKSVDFEKKQYVTSAAIKRVSREALNSLEEFYRPDMQLVERHFGIVTR